MWGRHGWAALLALLAAAGPVAAAGTEQRTFTVTVDGKPAGTMTATCRTAADGTETVEVATEVRVRTIIGTYRYTIRSTEGWKDGRLTVVTSATDDDGKKKTLRAVGGPAGLTVTAGGRTATVAPDVLSSTGWRAPSAGAAAATVLDVEDGTATAARVDALGSAAVTAGGKTVDAARYKLTGKGLDSQWWFDPAGRPVRQENVWDGHKVVLTLTAVTLQ